MAILNTMILSKILFGAHQTVRHLCLALWTMQIGSLGTEIQFSNTHNNCWYDTLISNIQNTANTRVRQANEAKAASGDQAPEIECSKDDNDESSRGNPALQPHDDPNSRPEISPTPPTLLGYDGPN
mmetsp:Transcript_12010/g.22865  ORF Transcript_12010/g.22865 Transcript_12010/m.22865 type:complete len:126 (+) Transcript_12010:76-453(+)